MHIVVHAPRREAAARGGGIQELVPVVPCALAQLLLVLVQPPRLLDLRAQPALGDAEERARVSGLAQLLVVFQVLQPALPPRLPCVGYMNYNS